jgi:hypothetical protein
MPMTSLAPHQRARAARARAVIARVVRGLVGAAATRPAGTPAHALSLRRWRLPLLLGVTGLLGACQTTPPPAGRGLTVVLPPPQACQALGSTACAPCSVQCSQGQEAVCRDGEDDRLGRFGQAPVMCAQPAACECR